jgi:acetyltransferase-like isoleucine patch superfamily enzyme
MIDAKSKRIAENASLENVNITAKDLVIEDNSKLTNVRAEAESIFISNDTVINDSIMLSKRDIKIGNHVRIREGSALNAFKGIRVGNDTLIDRGVVAAGMQSEKSYFEIGSRCVTLHHTYINTTREVIIGNNVGIGGYCMIFTHGVWQNAFKGYPFQYGKVEIRDDAWLPWHIFVMPGVTIGRGSTIAGGSVVTENVPDYTLVAGVPARVIRSGNYPEVLSIEKKNKLAKEVLQDFVRYMEEFIGNKSVALKEMSVGAALIKSDIGSLVYSSDFSVQLMKSPDIKAIDNICVVSFKVPDLVRKDHDWIELESETGSLSLNDLASEFATFIRRYGVRLLRDWPNASAHAFRTT